MKSNPKILFLDIETKPAIAYVWKLFDVNIGLEQLIQPGGVLCFGAKWYGERDCEFYSEWEHGREEMIQKAYSMMSDADAIITYNGDSFDIPKLKGEFIVNGLPPVPPCTSIDVFKAVKKFGFQSNKLAFVGPYLKIGKKVKNAGFSLWVDTMNGDPKAQKQMQRYCVQDVRLLEKLYDAVRGYIHNHPHLGEKGEHTCGACGSGRLHSRGFRRTRSFKIQRLQCQECGAWQDGKREKVG